MKTPFTLSGKFEMSQKTYDMKVKNYCSSAVKDYSIINF